MTAENKEEDENEKTKKEPELKPKKTSRQVIEEGYSPYYQVENTSGYN